MNWWVEDGQLIPPVPNRANYIHWIEDLLQLSSPPGAAPNTADLHPAVMLDLALCPKTRVIPDCPNALLGSVFS